MALGALCMPLFIQHKVLRSIRRSCSHDIRKWSKHELLFIYFLGDISVWVRRIALLLFQAELGWYQYPVVTAIWPLPVLKLR